MPTKPTKDDRKTSRFRGLFSRKNRTPSSAQGSECSTESSEQHTKHASTVRRTYAPRYADRDMILSVPVYQRPDLAARANETRLQRTCSDIGFNTASSSRVSCAQPKFTIPTHGRPTHPGLQQWKQPNINNSDRVHGPSRSISMPSVPLKHSERSKENYWKCIVSNTGTITSCTPSPNTSAEWLQVEAIDHALRVRFNLHQGYTPSEQSTTRSSSPGPGYECNTTHRGMATTSTARREKQYFSHNSALPNLRASVEKGKGKAVSRGAPMDYNIPQPSVFVSSAEGDVHTAPAQPVSAQSSGPHDELPDTIRSPSPEQSGSLQAYPPAGSTNSSLRGSHTSHTSQDIWSRANTSRSMSLSTEVTSVDENAGSQRTASEDGGGLDFAKHRVVREEEQGQENLEAEAVRGSDHQPPS